MKKLNVYTAADSRTSRPDGCAAGKRPATDGQPKSYRYLLVQSGSNNWYYGEEFKKFTEHYYSGSHPTGSIWDKPHPKWLSL